MLEMRLKRIDYPMVGSFLEKHPLMRVSSRMNFMHSLVKVHAFDG